MARKTFEPTAAAMIPGTSVWGHPHMELLTAAGFEIESAVHLLERLRAALSACPKPDETYARCAACVSLWGSAAMTRVAYAPDLDFTIRVHIRFVSPLAGQRAAYREMGNVLASFVRALLPALAHEADLELLEIRMNANNALASGEGLPEEAEIVWTPRALIEDRAESPLGIWTLATAYAYTAVSSLAFMTTRDPPRLVDVALDASFEADLGIGEFGAGPTSIWFGHLCATRDDADAARRREQRLARRFVDRYDGRRHFFEAYAAAVREALKTGQAVKALKRLTANFAFAGEERTVRRLGQTLRAPLGRLHKLATGISSTQYMIASSIFTACASAAAARLKQHLGDIAGEIDLAIAALEPALRDKASAAHECLRSSLGSYAWPAAAQGVERAAEALRALGDGEARALLIDQPGLVGRFYGQAELELIQRLARKD